MYDDETVEVPLQYMRNALWYYDNYFVLKDTVEKQDQVIDDLNGLVDEWEVAFDEQYTENRKLRSNIQSWKIFGITSGVLAAVLLFLEVYNEVSTSSSSVGSGYSSTSR